MTNEFKGYIGYYSQQAVDAGCGTCFWNTIDGFRIEVTAIYKQEDKEDYLWSDKKIVGHLTTYAGPGKKSDYQDLLTSHYRF